MLSHGTLDRGPTRIQADFLPFRVVPNLH